MFAHSLIVVSFSVFIVACPGDPAGPGDPDGVSADAVGSETLAPDSAAVDAVADEITTDGGNTDGEAVDVSGDDGGGDESDTSSDVGADASGETTDTDAALDGGDTPDGADVADVADSLDGPDSIDGGDVTVDEGGGDAGGIDGSDDGGTAECAPDETQVCGTDVGACTTGLRACIDGAFGPCEGAVEAVAEVCNGMDDDCDGVPDNAEALSAPLGDLQDGVCGGAVKVCDGANGWVEPDYATSSPDYGVETCDGTLDNDCDGSVDEDCQCTNTMTQPCGTDEGACVAGIQTCIGGTWGACEGQVTATDESCNGIDDDCDGVIDNAEALSAPLAGLQDGVCAGATQVCDGANGWIEPDYATYSADYGAEVCDTALDEDCDGDVDEDCAPPDPYDIGSCGGTPWTEAEALAYLGGAQRVVLAQFVAQERMCPGGVCGGPYEDWTIKFLAYSGGVTTNWEYRLADMSLVLFNDGGVPRLSIQHETHSLGGYDDDHDNGDGLLYDFPDGDHYIYPYLHAYDPSPSGNNYSELQYQVKVTEVTLGDGCLRWIAEPFGMPLTRQWAMLFQW